MSVTPNADVTQALLSLCEDKNRWGQDLNAAAVRKLVSEGADVNARGQYGLTPLHLAVRAPYMSTDPLPSVDVVRALIDAGGDVNARDDHARTPLLRAVPNEDDATHERRALEIFQVLRSKGATVPSDVKDGRAGAFSATCPSLYTELLDAGAAIDVRDDNQQAPLHRAAARGRVSIVEILLARGAEVNALDGLGRTPLGVALREQTKPWVKANHRTAEFNAVAKVLERAGGRPRVHYERRDDPFAPFPVDGAAVREALSKHGKFRFELEVDSAQEVATGLHGSGEPGLSLAFLTALRDVLGVPPRSLRLAGPLTLKSPFFHHGDLEVDGELNIDRPFAVTGNLVVHGVVRDNGNDSLVNVLGDMKCHGLYTDGEFSVAGDIEARDVVLGYYNDHILSARTIKARVVIEDDHSTDASVEAEHHFDLDTYSQGYGEGVPEQLRELFVDEVLQVEDGDEEARLDRGELFYRIGKGLPVFRK